MQKTDEIQANVRPHHVPVDMSDRVALGLTKLLRFLRILFSRIVTDIVR